MGYPVTLKPAAPALVAPLLWEIVRLDPELPAGTTFALFRLHLVTGYRFLGIYAGPELVGAVGFHGERIHIAVLPAWRGRWFSARIGAQIVAYGLQRVPSLLALVREGDSVTARLCAAVGFVRVQPGKWERWRLKAPAQGLARAA